MLRQVSFYAAVLATTVAAQEPLPLYEPADSFSFFLGVGNEIDPSLSTRFDTITVIDSAGARIALLDSLWQVHFGECCQDSTRWFTIGRYALDQSIDLERRAYVLGRVPGTLIKLDEDRSTAVIEKQRAHPPQPVLLSNSARSWWWWRDSLEMRSWWAIRREKHDHGPVDDREYRVPLDSCAAWSTDSVTELRCPARPGIYGGTADLLFFFVNDTLVDVRHDVRRTGLDGHGPFFYRAQGLLARYLYDGAIYFVFQSGEALRHDERGWIPVGRPAVRYYGECDCPDP